LIGTEIFYFTSPGTSKKEVPTSSKGEVKKETTWQAHWELLDKKD
jgi:hypothetical protein